MSSTNNCNHSSCHTIIKTPISRRNFLLKTALGAGITMAASFAPRLTFAAGKTEALLLSCMDYRFLDHIEEYMHSRGFASNYDHIVLAGASLGVLNNQNISWGQTFWDHVAIALKLHHIDQIIVIDHRDCGAYKVFLGEEYVKDTATEFLTHSKMLIELQRQIAKRYPQLKVETLLMNLDGKIEYIP